MTSDVAATGGLWSLFHSSKFWLSVWLYLCLDLRAPTVLWGLWLHRLMHITLDCPPIELLSLCGRKNGFQHQYLISGRTLISLILLVRPMVLQCCTIIDTPLELYGLKEDFSGKRWLLLTEEELENVLNRFLKMVVTWTILTLYIKINSKWNKLNIRG